jgi:hypothetical protein
LYAGGAPEGAPYDSALFDEGSAAVLCRIFAMKTGACDDDAAADCRGPSKGSRTRFGAGFACPKARVDCGGVCLGPSRGTSLRFV